MNIIDKYGITLINKAMDLYSGKKNIKIIDINNPILDEFLNDWLSSQDINEDLLPDIEMALADSHAKMENGSDQIYAYIYHNTVKFYKINDDDPNKIFEDYLVYELPTQDFKEIVLLWRDFLLTPPLNLTKV